MTALLSVLRLIWPYLVASLLGASLAWSIQDLRLTAEQQAFADYRLDQRETYVREMEAAETRRKESDEKSRKAQEELARQIAQGDVFRRCVAAGKCGAVVMRVDSCRAASSPDLPAAGQSDGAGANSIPVGTESATWGALANDCAVTTLQLNQLQADVESQPGFKQ